MRQLNLPIPSSLKVKDMGSAHPKIFDPFRSKWVALTPEEWVRQHFTAWLIAERGFPKSLMANEVGLIVSGRQRRMDTIVYARDGSSPLCIIEYKAPEVQITEATFRQAARYNMAVHAPILIVSNGLRHFCAKVIPGNDQPVYLPDIPFYMEIIEGHMGSTSG